MSGQATTISGALMTAQHYIDMLPVDEGYWLTEQRFAAIDRLFDLGLPHARQEAWRYTSVTGLLEQGFITTDEPGDIPEAEVQQHFLADQVAARLIFVDGLFQPALSDLQIEGVQLGNLRSAMAQGDQTVLQAVGSLSGAGEHGFSALNLATLQDGAMIRVMADCKLETPIELLHITSKAAAGRSLRPRHLIILEKNAGATLVERYLALDEVSYFNNLVCEIVLQEGSSLKHQRVQQESLQAYHLTELYLGLQADSHYQGVNVALGGQWSRTTVNNRFAAPGAICELDGLYLAGDGQLVDFHLDVDHAVPGCESRENFKGILNGRGRAVFDGRILVREQAQQSNAHLSNANLMLSRQAEIDTKPQLEILADDVQCSHGATVGQLDPQAMFYLRSRGLNEDQARRLLCLGFAQEILDRFELESLREQLQETIHQRLEAAVSDPI
ncbi:MAG: Fe-S cluster assembly protein SufD [Pseudomonadota bacterium]